MNDLSPKHQDKFRAYRARKKASGLREVRLWVPDLRDAKLRSQWQLEGALLRTHASEKAATDFIDAIIAGNAEFYE